MIGLMVVSRSEKCQSIILILTFKWVYTRQST